MSVKNYKDLTAWQKAMDLVEEVYRQTKGFPSEELYGLVAQMRRAAVSVPSNIAEGQGRGSDGDFLRFLRIAYGSLREIETQALIAVRLGFATEERGNFLIELSGEVGRLLNGLMNALQRDIQNTPARSKPPAARS